MTDDYGVESPTLPPADFITEFIANVNKGGLVSTARVAFEAAMMQMLGSTPINGNLTATLTKAQLSLITDRPERSIGYVLNDATTANNGIYTFDGTVWVKARDFPDAVTVLTTASGTNAPVTTTKPGVSLSSVVLFLFKPINTNTAAVTNFSINGIVKQLRNFDGTVLTAGALQAGVMTPIYDDGTYYKLMMDHRTKVQSDAAVAAADTATAQRILAEAATSLAQAYAAAAYANSEGAIAQVPVRYIRLFELDREIEARNDIIDYWALYNATAQSLVPTRPDIPEAPAEDTDAEENRERVIQRIEQLAAFEWEPAAGTLGYPQATPNYPKFYPPGVERKGPPYSSVRTVGRTIGQDISIETFLSAVRNPDSIVYKKDMIDLDPGGRAFYGAVCSNFLAYGFGWAYSPTTSHLATYWADWGFSESIPPGTFRAHNVRRGDIISSDDGGHIELILSNDGTNIVTFDQMYEGPRKTDGTDPKYPKYTYASFDAYVARRDYRLLRRDYSKNLVPYTPNPFSPLEGEGSTGATFNTVVQLDLGNKTNYGINHPIRMNIRTTVTNLLIYRDGALIETFVTTGNTIVSRQYTVPGNYSVRCTMPDGSLSKLEEFKIATITGRLAFTSVKVGTPCTVYFQTVNCKANVLLVERNDPGGISNRSLANRTPRPLTEQEIADGSVTFTPTTEGNFFVRVRAVNDFGAVFTDPLQPYIEV